jgi:hypothetical protein
MTGNGPSKNRRPPSANANLADVPKTRPPALARLDALVGEWEVGATFGTGYFAPGSPAFTARGGRTTFEWLPGEFFLVQRFTQDNPGAPSGIAIIGSAAEPDRFAQHYYDSRGVARVYEMSLDTDGWKLWRKAPGFWQRYRGVFSADGATITGAWEGSPDGAEWAHDFALTYIKIR